MSFVNQISINFHKPMSVPYVFSIAAVFAVVQIKVESRGKINVWIPWHGTPCREQV